MAPSLKNARSFFSKLVHPVPSRKVSTSNLSQSDRVPLSSVHVSNHPPPDYAVPTPTTERVSNARPIDPSEYLLEQVIDSSLRRLKTRGNSEYAGSMCSSTHLPLPTPKHTVFRPAQRDQENLQNPEEIESLTERSMSRHHNSYHQNRRIPHDRPGRRTSSAHRNLKANSSPRQDLHRKSAPRLADPNRISHSRRDRELLTAKKSLPILTKYARPTQKINTALF